MDERRKSDPHAATPLPLPEEPSDPPALPPSGRRNPAPERPQGSAAPAGAVTFEDIRERAYELWERNHRPEGMEMQFWLVAERELRAERERRVDAKASGDPVSEPAKGPDA